MGGVGEWHRLYDWIGLCALGWLRDKWWKQVGFGSTWLCAQGLTSQSALSTALLNKQALFQYQVRSQQQGWVIRYNQNNNTITRIDVLVLLSFQHCPKTVTTSHLPHCRCFCSRYETFSILQQPQDGWKSSRYKEGWLDCYCKK